VITSCGNISRVLRPDLPAEDQRDLVLFADLMRSDGRGHSRSVLDATTVDLAILCWRLTVW
jgi:hypothetical protein